MRKRSIFTKLLAMFIIFAIVIIGILWIMQSFFLNSFYQREKIKQMKSYGHRLEAQISDFGFSQESLEVMEEIALQLNGRVSVIDNNGIISMQQGMMMGMPRTLRIPADIWSRAQRGKTISYLIPGQLGRNDTIGLLIPAEEYYLLLQTPLQLIEESVAISQQFSLYILIAAFFVAVLLSTLLSRTITRPLIKLNQVAAEMSQLNFEARWDEDSSDEIGQLGKTINYLTDKLKITFNELKQELMKEKDLEKMRKQFVARVSHELQTPIAIVGGYAEALQDKVFKDSEEEKEYFEIIHHEMNKMSNMVRDLLDLSQLESGSFNVKMEGFEILGLIENVISKFKLLHRDQNLHFNFNAKKEEYFVIGDEYRIEQVVSNLIQNAVNHCKTNGNIAVSVNQIEDKVEIQVFNEGNQIDEKDLPYIWESFYKAKDQKSGTGLGLAIVKNVLQIHKSEYGVYNQPEGVVFYFDLKATQQSAEGRDINNEEI